MIVSNTKTKLEMYKKSAATKSILITIVHVSLSFRMYTLPFKGI